MIAGRTMSVQNGYPVGFRPQVIQFHEYQPGQGIPAHSDAELAVYSPVQSIVSLGSVTLLDFYEPPKKVSL
jgi:alkylated DNA repair dioxygenase AlkB